MGCMLSRFSHVQHFATPWTEAHQAPLSMGFPRQEHWSGLSFLFQGIFLTQGSNPYLLHWQVGSLPLGHLGSPLGNFRAYQTVIQLKTLLLLSSWEFSRVLFQEQNKYQICISYHKSQGHSTPVILAWYPVLTLILQIRVSTGNLNYALKIQWSVYIFK